MFRETNEGNVKISLDGEFPAEINDKEFGCWMANRAVARKVAKHPASALDNFPCCKPLSCLYNIPVYEVFIRVTRGCSTRISARSA